MPEYDFFLSVDRRALKGALDKLKKTFDARHNIPVLGNVEFTPDPFTGGAVARVTDMKTYHSVTLPGTCSGGKLMVDFPKLLKIVESLPEGRIELRGEAPSPVEMVEVEKFQCDLSTQWKRVPYKVMEPKPQPAPKVLGSLGKKTFTLSRWDHTGEGNTLPEPLVLFPDFPHETRELDLSALLAPVLHAVATDDSRYGLNGTYLELYSDGSVGAVSTDGHRCVAHQAHLSETDADGSLLPLGFSKNLKDTAPGRVVMTWWKPILCGNSLQGLATVDQSRLHGDTPLFRVYFDLGGDGKESRTAVRSRKQVTVYHKNSEGKSTPRLEWEEKIDVIVDQDPRTATCTVRTTQEILSELLSSHVSLDDWLARPDVTVLGDVSHFHALYGEAQRSSFVQVEHPDGTVLVTRCLEGDFPDWRQIVPAKFLREATVDRKVLDEAVKYVMTVASEKTHCVAVTVQEGEIRLDVENPDGGELSDEVPAETTGELSDEVVSRKSDSDKETTETRPFAIGLNGQYLRDELKILSGDRVELRFGDSLSIGILRRPGDDSLFCLIGPMRLK